MPIQQHKPDEVQVERRPMVVVVIPFGLAGAGKSFCFRALQAKIQETEGCTFDVISSDGIRGEMVQKLMEKEKITRDDAFQKTAKSANKEYGFRFFKLLENAQE